MRVKALLSVPVLCASIGLLALGFTACGSDDDSDSGPTGAETTEPTGTATEPSGDSVGGENALAPSGDAVRSEKVEIVDFAYEPDPVRVKEGGKVIWVNEDSAPHTATAEDGSFDTGTLEEGKLKSETFKQPGTYKYICSIHPEMQGTVEVVEDSSGE